MLFINPELGEEWNRTVLSESVNENAPELIEIKTHIPEALQTQIKVSSKKTTLKYIIKFHN